MTGLQAYVLSKRIAASSISGISNVTVEGNNLIFTLKDGTKVSTAIPPGSPGEDGFSPTIETLPIDGGTKLIITDIDGPHEINIMDGVGGEASNLVPNTLFCATVENPPSIDQEYQLLKSNYIGAVPILHNEYTAFLYNKNDLYFCDAEVIEYNSNNGLTKILIKSTQSANISTYNKQEIDEKINAIEERLSWNTF